MSGFPGQHGYAEFAANQRRLDRDEAKNDIPTIPRTPDADEIVDKLRLRARMTEERRSQAVMEAAADYIAALHELIGVLQKTIKELQGRHE